MDTSMTEVEQLKAWCPLLDPQETRVYFPLPANQQPIEAVVNQDGEVYRGVIDPASAYVQFGLTMAVVAYLSPPPGRYRAIPLSELMRELRTLTGHYGIVVADSVQGPVRDFVAVRTFHESLQEGYGATEDDLA